MVRLAEWKFFQAFFFFKKKTGDSRKLDDLIRSHYSSVVADSSATAQPPALSAFSSQDSMFTSHERLPSGTRSRQNSDPLGVSSSSRDDSPKKEIHRSTPEQPSSGAASLEGSSNLLPELRKSSVGSLTAIGAVPSSIVFKPGTQEILKGSASDLVFFLVNVNRDRDFLSRFLLLFRQFMTTSDLMEGLRILMENAPASEKQAVKRDNQSLFNF